MSDDRMIEGGGLIDVPRRCQLNFFTPAELAIRDAVLAVEVVGADVRLTDAVVLLQQAREKVADFVDGITAAAPLSICEGMEQFASSCNVEGFDAWWNEFGPNLTPFNAETIAMAAFAAGLARGAAQRLDEGAASRSPLGAQKEQK